MKKSKLAISLIAIFAASALVFSGCGKSDDAQKNAFGSAAPAAKTTVVPIENLAEENASLVLILRDVPSLIQKLKNSPAGKTWNDPQIEKFLKPLRKTYKMDQWGGILKSRTGMSVDELETLIQGDCMLAISNLPALSTAASDENADKDDAMATPEILFVADVGANKNKIDKFLTDNAADGQNNIQSETYAGVTIKTEMYVVNRNRSKKLPDKTPPKASWAIIDGRLCMSVSLQTIKTTIDALAGDGAPNSLGKSTRYLAMQQRIGNSQFFILYNVHEILASIIQKLAETQKQAMQLDSSGGKDTDPDKMFSALGLDTLNDFYCGITFTDEGIEGAGALTYSEKRGVLKLLAFGNEPLRMPDFVPSAWPSANVLNLNVPAFYAAVEDMIASIRPEYSSMLQHQLKMAAKRYGVDIKRDIIGSLGGQIVSANVLPSGTDLDDPQLAKKTGALYIIALKDRKIFQNSIDTLLKNTGMDSSPMLEKRDYLGGTLYTATLGATTVSIGILQNQLVVAVGQPGIAENVMQNIVNGVSESLNRRADFREFANNAPTSAVSLGTQSMSFTLRLITNVLTMIPAAEKYVDLSVVPDAATFEKYWGNIYSVMSDESSGIYFKAKMAGQLAPAAVQ